MGQAKLAHLGDGGVLAVRLNVGCIEAATERIFEMRRTLYGAGALSIVSALLHLWESPAGFEEWWGIGVFFLVAALAQGLYGAALLRWPVRSLAVLGVWGGLAIVVLHVVMRAVPSGSSHASGLLGVLATLCAAAGVVLLFGALAGAAGTLYAAGALSIGAALVHLLEAPEHFEEWWGFGVFFLTAGLAQGLYSLMLPHLGGRPLFLLAGIAGNLSIVALWLVTRTAGVPYVRTTGVETFELRLGMVEGVGVADLAVTTAEVMLVAALGLSLAALYRRGGGRFGRRPPEGRGAGLAPTQAN